MAGKRDCYSQIISLPRMASGWYMCPILCTWFRIFKHNTRMQTQLSLESEDALIIDWVLLNGRHTLFKHRDNTGSKLVFDNL